MIKTTLEATDREIDYLSESDYGDGIDYQILCPVCGDPYVHSGQATELSGKDAYAAAPDRWVRGDVLQIPFWCESGHYWLLQIGFHKGNTFVRAVILDPSIGIALTGRSVIVETPAA